MSAPHPAPVGTRAEQVETRRQLATELCVGVALVLLAFVLRWLAAERYGFEPVWDGHYYDYYARRFAEGFGYTDARIVDGVDVGHPSCHYPVGFSAVLGAVYWLFGHSLQVAHAFAAAVGAAVVGVGYALARRALGWKRAVGAGMMVASHPGLVLQAALVMSESLASLSTLLALLVAVELRHRGRAWWGALLGAALLGASALVRPPALFLVPFLLPWSTPLLQRWMQNAWANRAVGVVVLCATALLPIVPWTARNCRAMDGCALVSTNGGWNLAIGAFPRATGRFETLRSSDGCREVTGQVQQDRCWLHYGLGYIASEPLHWASLAPKKLHHTFDHESFQVGYLRESQPALWSDDFSARMREGLTNFHRMLVLAAACALVRLPARALRGRERQQAWTWAGASVALIAVLGVWGLSADEPWVWPLALVAGVAPWLRQDGRSEPLALRLCGAFVLTVALTSVLFFGEDRYHLVASPALVLLAAAAFRPRPATSS